MQNNKPALYKNEMKMQQVKRSSDFIHQPLKRVKFTVPNGSKIGDDIYNESKTLQKEITKCKSKTEQRCNSLVFQKTIGKSQLKRKSENSDKDFSDNSKKANNNVRFDSEQTYFSEWRNFRKNCKQNQQEIFSDGLPTKIKEKIPFFDQKAKIKKLAESVKGKRSNDRKTVDSHNLRTSPTNEVYRLKNLIETQENEILLLQAKLDSKIENSSHEVLNKQKTLKKDCTDVDTFPAICNSSEFPFDDSNSRGFSSLITISHHKNSEEMTLRKENLLLKNELQEAKDHMELLEFRILEFTEDQKTPQTTRCDQGTSTEQCCDNQGKTEKSISSQCNPLSKDYLQECHKRLLDIFNSNNYKSSSSHLQSFLELREQFNKYCDIDLPISTELNPVMENFTVLDDLLRCNTLDHKHSISSSSLDQENKLLEEKDNELDILSKLEALTKENKELQELITTLSESHETRTEASATESEQVHGKTPSISSELSDTECDVLPNIRDIKTSLQNSTSLQESGIFESQCDVVDAMTQTCATQIEECNPLSHIKEKIALDVLPAENNDYVENITNLKEIPIPQEFTNDPEFNTEMRINDVSAIRVQDLQESDEYLLGHLDDRIILSKSEYDAIVAEERTLRVRIEELNAETVELSHKCSATEEQLELAKSKTSTADEKESMRGAVRVLEEQLQSAEKHSKQFFEEKCEYEEAENDARLMVQRLQSQLDAAQEMEALLSASLSQEQEFSRELQKCLRDIQVDIEREEKVREENYLLEINVILEREKRFISEAQILKVYYFMLVFKLLVKEYFRTGSNRSKLNQITNGERVSEDFKHDGKSSQLCNNTSSFHSQLKLVSESPVILDQLLPKLMLSTYSRITTPKINSLHESLDVEMTDHGTNEGRMDTPDFYSEKVSNGENMSDRESFYLKQIEILHQEKKNLRNDFETNDGERFQQYLSCRNELENIGDALDKSESEKCKLLFNIEELQYDLQNAKDTNDLCIQNIKMDYSSICDNLRREKKDISSHYEARIDDMKKLRRSQEIKVEECNRKLTCIHLQLAPYIDDAIRTGSQETCNDDIFHVTNLVKSEASLRDKIFELQEKERAYMETIAEADKIMSAHVTSYNKRITELETKLKAKNPILTNLVDRLQSMKEKLYLKGNRLDTSELEEFFRKTQLEIRKLNISGIQTIDEGNFLDNTEIQENEEKALDSEFHEKEELLQKLLKLTTQNSAISSQLQEAHEASRKMSEMLQNEHYFRSRVEELESSETYLREDLKKYEYRMNQKDRKHEEKVNLLKDEICCMKSEMESTQREINQAKKSEFSVKNELTEMKNLIHSLKSDLQESSDENANNDSQHRLEVAKLRSQLNTVNNQLIEIGGINGDLQEKFISSEHVIKEVTTQLQEKEKRYEADVLSLNLKLSQKDSCIEDMEAHMQQLKHNEAASELDGLSSLPFSDLHNTLKEISEGLKMCSKCSERYSASIDALNEYSETFTELIHGRTAHSDSESEGEKSKLWNFTKSSLDDQNNFLEEDFHHNLSRLADIYPCVPPRPRRDAKLKRKWRRSSNNEESILNELQATVKNTKKISPNKVKIKEMKQNIKSLENKVKVREEELQLADLEVTELYGKLATENETIQMKEIEISNIQNTMVTFRKEYITTVEKNEKAKQDTEEKHKEEIEAKNKLTKEMNNQLSHWKQITKERSHLLKSIIDVIKSEVCPKRLYIVLSLVLKCVVHPETSESDYTNDELREDVERMIKQISGKQQQIVNIACSEVKCNTEESNLERKTDLLQIQSINIARANIKPASKSKIPKIIPTNFSHLKRNNSDHSKQHLKRTASDKQYTSTKKYLTKVNLIQNKSSKTNCHESKTNCHESKTIFHNDMKKASANPIKIIPKIGNKAVANENNTSIHTNRNTSNGDCNIEQNISQEVKSSCSQNNLSPPSRCYLRSLKRIIPLPGVKHVVKKTSVTPSCTMVNQQKLGRQIDIPRPQNLKITRRVGIDGVVIAWEAMNNDCIAGFQVIVDGRVTQQVRSPKRTKALVNGLPFHDGFSISLSTISTEGYCSIPVTVTHKRPLPSKRKNLI